MTFVYLSRFSIISSSRLRVSIVCEDQILLSLVLSFLFKAGTTCTTFVLFSSSGLKGALGSSSVLPLVFLVLLVLRGSITPFDSLTSEADLASYEGYVIC